MDGGDDLGLGFWEFRRLELGVGSSSGCRVAIWIMVDGSEIW